MTSVRFDGAPLVALAALVAGIVAGERAGADPAGLLLLGGAVALALAWTVAGRARLAVACCALALLGCAVMQRALDGLAGAGPLDGREVVLAGTLAADPDSGRFRTEVDLRADGVDRVVLVRAASEDVSRLRVLAAGDHVVLRGRLVARPDDFSGARAKWRHAAALLDEAHVEAFSPPSGVLPSGANRMRVVMQRGAAPLPAERRALLAGFLLGDTRQIPDEVVEQYRDAGLSHLLAVSGANVAFVLACCAPLLRRLPLGLRSATAVAIVVLFAAMTRFEPSVLRASAVTGVTVFSVLVGRPASRVRVLALAVIGVLLVDPFLVHSVGFQLSVAAAAGIAIAAQPIARRLPGPRGVRDVLATSLAAQAGVTPALLLTFGEVPLVTPVTNLLAVSAAEVVGVYGFLASLVGGLVPPLAPVLQPLDDALIRWISFVAHVGAQVPFTIDRRGACIVAAVVAAVTVARRSRQPTRRALRDA
jgi:competence protein ComEC